MAPEDFYAVGQWYEDFSQTTNEEVTSLLANAGLSPGLAPAAEKTRPKVA